VARFDPPPLIPLGNASSRFQLADVVLNFSSHSSPSLHSLYTSYSSCHMSYIPCILMQCNYPYFLPLSYTYGFSALCAVCLFFPITRGIMLDSRISIFVQFMGDGMKEGTWGIDSSDSHCSMSCEMNPTSVYVFGHVDSTD